MDRRDYKKRGESLQIRKKRIKFAALKGKSHGNRGVAQSGSAPGLGPGGRRFESCHPDKKLLKTMLLNESHRFKGFKAGHV